MGKPGAKKMDQIVSVTPGDVHIIMIPSPGGPVPTPIPHPCASMIKDKVATKVKVMGQPGAVKGSKSKHTPPHIPMGPGPFQKPPKNEGEIVTGSSSVFYEGKEAAMLGDTGKMCSDPSDTPVGKVIGTAAMVLVGGGGSGGDAERAQASAAAMKAAAAASHKWIAANMPPGAEREKAHRDVCTATGHPIDVATGKLFTRNVDLKLPGRIPLEFVRNYSSARSDLGAFGRSWRHSYEAQLIVHRDFVAHRDANGRFLEFEPIAVGAFSRNKLGRLTLRRSAEGYSIEQPGFKQFFPWSSEPSDAAVTVPVRQIVDHYGNNITFEYTSLRLTKIIDSAGRIILLDYNERGFISALRLIADPVIQQAETIRTYGYSVDDDLVEVRDVEGHVLRFAYENHLLVQEKDRNGFSFYFTYDKDGWCRETWGDGALFYRRLEYDHKRQLTRCVDSLGYVTTYYWTELGVVVREEDHEGNAWSFDYNDALQQTRAEDPLGNIWAYEYDQAGRLVAGEEPDGVSFAFAWRPDGRMQSRVDRGGNEWKLDYRDDRFETEVTDPQGRKTVRVYNERGDLVTIRTGANAAHEISYDTQGNCVAETLPTELRIHRGYNATGDLIRESDQFGPRMEIDYDAERRRRRIWWRQRGERQYIRNGEGQVVAVVDAKGGKTLFERGNFNRVTRITYPAVQLAGGELVRPTRSYDYDTENRVRVLTLNGADCIRFEYGQGRRALRIAFPDGRVQEFERNARGHCKRFVESGHLVFDQETDASGRVLRRTSGDGEEASFEYDSFGRLVAATNDAGAIQMEYDEVGRVVREGGIFGELCLGYDDQGRLHMYDWDKSIALDLHQEDLRRRRWQRRGRADAIDLAFDARGRMTKACFSSGETHEQEFGPADLPVRRAIWSRLRQREEDLYEYDASGLLQRTRSSYRSGRHYVRDALDRLTGVAEGEEPTDRRLIWGFDRLGNRTHATDPSGSRYEQRYTAGNRLVALRRSLLMYDNRGRLVERTSAEGTTRFRWNALGQLLKVELPNGETLCMRYDALGRRIEKRSSSCSTRFGWRGKRLVHEWQGDKLQRHYLYQGDSFRPLAFFEQNDNADWLMHSIACDPRGCPESVGGPDGQTAWRAEVAPWGEVGDPQPNGFVQNLGMPGQYRDTETGLSYNFARFYLPEAGAFLSPDPAGLSGGDNPYAYSADPICFIDPLGLSEADYDGDVVKIYHGTVDQELLDATGGFTTKDRYGQEGTPPFVCVSTDRTGAEDAIDENRQYSRSRHYAQDRIDDPDADPTRRLHEGSMSREEWDRLHANGDLTTNDYGGMNGNTPGVTETKARTPAGVAALNRAFGFPGEQPPP